MLSTASLQANSLSRHSATPTVGQSQCAPQHEVSVVRHDLTDDEQRQLDEGVDYFSAQGAIDRWKLKGNA